MSGYPGLLYKKTVEPLVKLGKEGIEMAVPILDAYGLRKEHLMEHLTEMRQHLGQEDLFQQVDAQVKSAMTREFNSGNHAMRVVLPSKGKRKAAALDADPDLIGEGEKVDAGANKEDEENEGEEEDTGSGALIKIKAKAKAKGKAKSKAEASSSQSR